MKKRHTEEQIIRILKEAETGIPVADLLREYDISQGISHDYLQRRQRSRS